MKLTPEQLAEKKRLDKLNKLCNSILSGFAFRNIKTWADVYQYTGIPNTGAHDFGKAVVLPELKAYLEVIRNPPKADTAHEQPAPVVTAPPPVVVVAPSVVVPSTPAVTEVVDEHQADYG